MLRSWVRHFWMIIGWCLIYGPKDLRSHWKITLYIHSACEGITEYEINSMGKLTQNFYGRGNFPPSTLCEKGDAHRHIQTKVIIREGLFWEKMMWNLCEFVFCTWNFSGFFNSPFHVLLCESISGLSPRYTHLRKESDESIWTHNWASYWVLPD